MKAAVLCTHTCTMYVYMYVTERPLNLKGPTLEVAEFLGFHKVGVSMVSKLLSLV